MLQEQIEKLKHWIMDSDNIVFFGGAGVSTESGIPDFRSADGIYHTKYKLPPETILSHSYFMRQTREFYEFYREKMIYTNIQPNITHKRLAQLEAIGKVKGIITQNIDGLHQMAGSNKVLELHGSILRNYCMKCQKLYELKDILKSQDIPTCECSGFIKPDVILYEEALDDLIMDEAVHLISRAKLLIVGGTSLSVYPAAGLLRYYKGDKLVLINKAVTEYDGYADLLINAGLGEVFTMV